MQIIEAKEILQNALKSGSEPPMDLVTWIIRDAQTIPEKYRSELAFLCACAILPFNIDLFYEVARILYPSYWYIDLISYAIDKSTMLNKDWRDFYRVGLQGIRDLPMGLKSLSYATLAMSVSNISKAYSYDLIMNSVKTLPFAYTSVFGGTALRSARLFVKIGFEVEKNIRMLTNIVNATMLLPPVYKIDVLSKISIYVKDISRELVLDVLKRCFNLFKYLGPKSIMEAEAIMTNTLVEIFYDDIEALSRLSDTVDKQCRDAIKHAMIRILQDRERKPFYALDIEKYGDRGIYRAAAESIGRKKDIRKKLSEKLEKSLFLMAKK